MIVEIESEQIKRIGFDILHKIYGPLRKYWGEIYSEVYVDDNWKPRIGYYNSILSPKAVSILREDYEKFKRVIPLNEIQFAELFTAWLRQNYSITNVDKLTTTTEDKLKFRKPFKTSNYY